MNEYILEKVLFVLPVLKLNKNPKVVKAKSAKEAATLLTYKLLQGYLYNFIVIQFI